MKPTSLLLVTGPYSTKNEPTIDDQRLDRAQAVLYLDRRTHRGDPPAWLPPFWTKPGIYPLTHESTNIIKMVSSLPFDRNATTSVVPAASRIIGPPSLLPPNNFYQQPSMLFGGVGSPGMMGMPHPMMSPLLQQQQLQHMLQYQYQQQQLQNMSNPPIPSSPSPSLSSYTQRKPISTPSPLISSSQRQTPSLSPPRPKEKRSKSIQVTPSTSLSSASSTTASKPRRKKPKSLVEKRRVRFTEDQPEIKFFDSDRLWVEGLGQVAGGNEDLYYGDGDDGYYQSNMYPAMDHDHTDYFDDDSGYYMQQRDVYDPYDESSYEQRPSSEHYYTDAYDDYGDYSTSEHYPDLHYAGNPARYPPFLPVSAPNDDNEADCWYTDEGDIGTYAEWNDDPRYSHDPYHYHDGNAVSDDAYLEEDYYEPETQHPSDIMLPTGHTYYPSPQRHRASRSSKRYDPPPRRSISVDRHLWQPSRGSQH